jgi:hypothetical protein
MIYMSSQCSLNVINNLINKLINNTLMIKINSLYTYNNISTTLYSITLFFILIYISYYKCGY